MSTNEDRAPLGAPPEAASPHTDAAEVESAAAADGAAGEAGGSSHDSLSPAVRRLVRQFDLDITGIHGTGPEGRIRVGDVMGLLAGRTDSGNRDAPARPLEAEVDGDDANEPDHEDAVLESATAPVEPVPVPASTGSPAAAGIPTSTIFDCDFTRVLSHRKKLRGDGVELLAASYVLTALAAALDATPGMTAGQPPRFGLALTTADGEICSMFLDTTAVAWDIALDSRVRAFDAALRANIDADSTGANLLVYHYAESGSLLATPTPIGAGHAASVGIGRVRREIVVRAVDGVEAPRVAPRCYVSLSFLPERVAFHHANRALATAVRILETWPE